MTMTMTTTGTTTSTRSRTRARAPAAAMPTVIEAPPAAPPVPRTPAAERREALSATLPTDIELLGQRRTSEVSAEHLEDYVELGWLRWAGGRLVVTTQGSAVRNSEVERDERRTGG